MCPVQTVTHVSGRSRRQKAGNVTPASANNFSDAQVGELARIAFNSLIDFRSPSRTFGERLKRKSF